MGRFKSGLALRSRRRALVATVLVVAASALGVHAAAGQQTSSSDPIASGWNARSLEGKARPRDVQNNLAGGALARRDRAVSAWRAALARYRQGKASAPNPLAKPEYVVVWAGNSNASDEHGQQAQGDAGAVLADPLGATGDKQDRFVPGLDGFVVLDARRRNVDGSPNPTYGKVANFVQLPLPWGLEGEPHHMQYQWENGQPLLAGGLFNDTTWVMNVRKVPELSVENTIAPQDTPGGSVPDAYDASGAGRMVGTYMGGPEYNFAGSPGEVVVFKPDKKKGYVVASETPAGAAGARQNGNPGGIPEPCGQDEAAPLDTCANPHGIQVRPDLGRMVTSDYGEPKMVVLDPAKPNAGQFFRPTVRVWNTTDADHPKLLSVAHMGRGWRRPGDNTMHYNRGVMENAKTWPVTPQFPGTLPSKGFFAGAMCGGGVFFTPDVTKLGRDSTRQWKQVFDDGIALMAARHEPVDQFLENEGPCEGGAWTQVSRNNHWLFRAVTGQAPNVENNTNDGQPVKVIYDMDVAPLIKSAQDGSIACDLARGIDTNGDGKIDLSGVDAVKRVAEGQQVADCPRLISTLTVNDQTSGGPHWGAIDNHSLTRAGFPTRMVFSDYFVARSGVDGNHRLYMVNIDPASGRLSYDNGWRDEGTHQLGTDFNRHDWPGNPGAGYYKPHSMVWVCPPGVCPADSPGPPAPRGGTAPAGPSTTTWSGSCHLKGHVDFAKPVHLTIENNDFESFMSGTCTGTLNGKPFNGPVTAYTDARMNKPFSCLVAIGNEMPSFLQFGPGSLSDVNATLLENYTTLSISLLNASPFTWRGAFNGHGTGQATVESSQAQFQQCGGPGLRSANLDVTEQTTTPLYG